MNVDHAASKQLSHPRLVLGLRPALREPREVWAAARVTGGVGRPGTGAGRHEDSQMLRSVARGLEAAGALAEPSGKRRDLSWALTNERVRKAEWGAPSTPRKAAGCEPEPRAHGTCV